MIEKLVLSEEEQKETERCVAEAEFKEAEKEWLFQEVSSPPAVPSVGWKKKFR